MEGPGPHRPITCAGCGKRLHQHVNCQHGWCWHCARARRCRHCKFVGRDPAAVTCSRCGYGRRKVATKDARAALLADPARLERIAHYRERAALRLPLFGSRGQESGIRSQEDPAAPPSSDP